jgi:tight adherence protein B
MTALLVMLLCLTAIVVLGCGKRRLAPMTPGLLRLPQPRQRTGKTGRDSADELPMFVRQMASLLRSGRTPAQMWADILRVYEPDEFRAEAGRTSTGAERPDRSGEGLPALLLPGMRSAGQASGLGLSVGFALRQANVPGAGTRLPAAAMTRRMWQDMAACWDAAEQTGAPLAVLLENYAGHLQHTLDGAAARRTALAGPRATTTLLTWLPIFGLGLGIAMGADPLGILLGTPAGWAILAVGLGLLAAGRLWSQHLVSRAADG